MKFAKLLHNPGSGDGEHTENDISRIITAAGFKCSSTPIKKMTQNTIDTEKYDMVALAGGDGTVRKAAKQLLDDKLPIGLIPMGTANNIAKTLGIEGSNEKIIESWNKENKKRFDVGKIDGLHRKKSDFFLEGVGYGVFPKLMKEMKKQNKEAIDNPDRKMKTALELLYDIVMSYKAKRCRIKIDGVDYSGEFLLVEVMNTRSIGPNLLLAPLADPGDGEFDVVLISAEQRQKFADYILHKVNDMEKPSFFHILRTAEIEMHWEGKSLHIDDKCIELDKTRDVRISIHPQALEFLVP